MVESTAAARADGHARLGMAIFLGTWVMLFAALLLAYAVVRAQAPAWPPAGLPRLPRALPGLATLVLVASSVLLRTGWVGGATVLGGVFVALQAILWRVALVAGLLPATGAYASVFYALTIFHALHVAVGMVLLAVLRGATGLRLAALFWDFVTIAWVVIYGAVFWL